MLSPRYYTEISIGGLDEAHIVRLFNLTLCHLQRVASIPTMQTTLCKDLGLYRSMMIRSARESVHEMLVAYSITQRDKSDTILRVMSGIEKRSTDTLRTRLSRNSWLVCRVLSSFTSPKPWATISLILLLLGRSRGSRKYLDTLLRRLLPVNPSLTKVNLFTEHDISRMYAFVVDYYLAHSLRNGGVIDLSFADSRFERPGHRGKTVNPPSGGGIYQLALSSGTMHGKLDSKYAHSDKLTRSDQDVPDSIADICEDL